MLPLANAKMKVAILYNDVSTATSPDELDILAQINYVAATLKNLQHEPVTVPVTLNLAQVIDILRKLQPGLAFNLVESIAGSEKLLHFAAALLDYLKIPYTGNGTHALYLTTNKIFTKQKLQSANLPTPPWQTLNEVIANGISFKPPYIIKPISDDASVGINSDSVVYSADNLVEMLKQNSARYGECFVEAYIPGREFNLSLLANDSQPEVLPPAEIRFINFPADQPQIVDYKAKWEVESFEYRNTVRRFDFDFGDKPLLAKLIAMAVHCWEVFGLRGYARVDFRVDDHNNTWILEINANPCISPDSGFVAAAQEAGITFEQVVVRIIQDSLKN
jgi:D-alanine-D-alanine ligase